MIYKFDLIADDYAAASLSCTSTRSVVRSYVPYALVLALAFWILLRHGAEASSFASFAAAMALFLGMLAYYALTWQKTFARALVRYHEGPRSSILGPHTLELTENGLDSSGPLHRSFRAWASVTGAVVSPSHVFFPTLFGLVYVLPRRAIDDFARLIASLEEYGVHVTEAGRGGSDAHER
jgi:hypothetical protein